MRPLPTVPCPKCLKDLVTDNLTAQEPAIIYTRIDLTKPYKSMWEEQERDLEPGVEYFCAACDYQLTYDDVLSEIETLIEQKD